VRIIARSTLIRFVENHSAHKDRRALEAALNAWFIEVKRAAWKNSSDVKASYSQASIVGSERVVFNICGNTYRLVAAIDYRKAIVFIKWIGTHKEYNAIDVRTIQYATETN
jgi:mRNA interferase HigB